MTPSRKPLFAVLAVVLAVVVLEIGSFLLLSLRSGRLATHAVIGAERAALSAAADAPIELDALVSREEQWVQSKSFVHPFLGFVRDPASSPQGSDPEALEHGFAHRGPIFFEPSPERVVVVVLGGSVARSLAVAKGVLEAALESSPRFAGREVVVASLAAGGYKQPQQLIALNYFLSLGAHFDLVLNLDGLNEVILPAERNVPRGVFPFFPVDWDLRLGELDLEARRRIGALTYLRERRRLTAALFSRAPWRYSLTAALVWKSLDGVAAARVAGAEAALHEAPEDHAEHDYRSQGPRRSYASSEEMYRDLAAVWGRASWQLHVLCAGLGVEYHHFLQPNQYLPGSKPLSAKERQVAYKADHRHRRVVEEGYPWLIEAGRELREKGVAFHDLTQIFAGTEETLYRDFCCHLNRRGNQALAAAVARALAEAAPVSP